jgi:hypothetical protein
MTMHVVLCVALLLAAQAPSAVIAQEPPPSAAPDGETPAADRIDRHGDLVTVFGSEVRVPAGTLQHGNVVCIGGRAIIEGDVSGDVVVILGDLEGRGTVTGAVTAVLSDVVLENAVVEGELVSVLSDVELESTRVRRELISVMGRLDRDEASSEPAVNFGLGWWLPDLEKLLFWLRLLRLVGVFVTLLLLVAIVPERVRLIAEEAPVRYGTAFFVGLLGHLGLLVVLGLLTATLVGLPLAFLLWVTLKWLGIAGMFFAVGRRLGRAAGREISLLGAVLLVFALYALLTLAPTPLGLAGLAVSALLWSGFFLLVQVPAIGLVLLTLAGTRSGRVVRAATAAPPAP